MDKAKDACPELRGLPKDWTFGFTKGEYRVFYKKESTGDQTFIHPTLGELPKPWRLRMKIDERHGVASVLYVNCNTGGTSTQDPRFMLENIKSQSRSVDQELSIAASLVLNSSKYDISKFARSPIQDHSIRHQFQIIHTIDPGDGTIGGMNGGVFVVRMIGLLTRLFVEKRFKKDDVFVGKNEIEMLERVKHPGLTHYTAAFVMPDLSDASLYVEFCDRGSLEEFIKEYMVHSDGRPKPIVPEAFVWHALTGLCDGLAYLQSGVSIYQKKEAVVDSKWMPVLHRDIKPDNVLLRSRSTLGSGKYYYCVLSDFGLACEDLESNHPRCDLWQRSGSKIGTKAYWAPELLYHPYPQSFFTVYGVDERQWKIFPDGCRHTRYSDLWALGAAIFNLCALTPYSNGLSHIDLSKKPDHIKTHQWWEGAQSRYKVMSIPKPYTEHLRQAIMIATTWNRDGRPSPVRMVGILVDLMRKSGFHEQGKSEPLPDWATRVHGYHSKAERVEREGKLRSGR